MTALERTANHLQYLAQSFRRTLLGLVHEAGSGHRGGSSSAAELITTLYLLILNANPENPRDPARDRFVLSKGHAAPMLYTVLAEKGFFPTEELHSLRKLNSGLQGHPCMQFFSGDDLTTVMSGIPAFMAHQAAGELEKAGHGTDLFAVTTLKPFNGEEIFSSLARTGKLLTIEEHNRVGGLRSTILENMPDGISIRSDQISIDDTYCESGPYMELMEKYGISPTRIFEKSSKLIAL